MPVTFMIKTKMITNGLCRRDTVGKHIDSVFRYLISQTPKIFLEETQTFVSINGTKHAYLKSFLSECEC